MSLKDIILRDGGEHANGYVYSTYSLDSTEYRMFHCLSNERLEDETFEEYRNRTKFVKHKVKNRARLVWPSKNSQAVADYKVATYLIEDPKKLDRMKQAAIEANLGTYNKEKLKQVIKAQEEEE